MAGRVIMRARLGAAEVGTLPARIGPDDEKVRARRLALMGDPGRDHDDIAGAQFDGLPALPAEPHRGISGGDAQHLMRRAVVMVMSVDAVAPGAGPAVSGKHRLAGRGAVAAFSQNPAVDHERQRIVRHDAVIGETIGLDLKRRWVSCHKKGLGPGRMATSYRPCRFDANRLRANLFRAALARPAPANDVSEHGASSGPHPNPPPFAGEGVHRVNGGRGGGSGAATSTPSALSKAPAGARPPPPGSRRPE